MIQADPTGQFVLHVDLGLDKILVWKFDARTRCRSRRMNRRRCAAAGRRAAALSFHPNGRWLYSIQEEGSTIVPFDFDAATGRLTERQTISSLPPGFAGSNFCSEILMSADGRFVYAGNRLHDSIGISRSGRTASWHSSGEEWTRGNYPRSFSFDPSGNFYIVAISAATTSPYFGSDRPKQAGSIHGATYGPSAIRRALFSSIWPG